MKQAPGFDGLPFDPFSFFQNGLAASEVDIGRGEVLQALVIAPMVVMIDEGLDLPAKIARQVVVFQQDAVLQSLMPAFDLALGLRMIRGAADMIHLLIFKPICLLARDVAGSVVAEQTWFVQHRCLITARCLQRQVERVGDIARFHRSTELPCNDVPAVVVQDCAEIEPSPPDDLEICEVSLPQLVWPSGLVFELVCG